MSGRRRRSTTDHEASDIACIVVLWTSDSALTRGVAPAWEGRACKAARVSSRPSSRREACREDLCVRLGYCGGDRWLLAADLDGETADAVAMRFSLWKV